MICTTWGSGKDKKGRSCTQFYHDWKPMQSIIGILHKNFFEDHADSRFPGVADTLSKLLRKMLGRKISYLRQSLSISRKTLTRHNFALLNNS